LDLDSETGAMLLDHELLSRGCFSKDPRHFLMVSEMIGFLLLNFINQAVGLGVVDCLI
jgi:hypothetical protein